MSSVRPTTVLLVLSLCYTLHVHEAYGIIRHYRSLPADYYQPVQHHRVRRQAPVPPPQPLRDCPCSSNPCLNGGVCSSVAGSVPNTVDFTCTCRGEWTGSTCDNCPTGSPICSQSCLAFRNNDVCNDGGLGSINAKCSLGTDCNDCHSRCPPFGR